MMTRKTAIGSLVPDSISSVAPTRCCSRRPPVRSRKKTAAASVEAMIVPRSSAPTGSRSSTSQATPPATPAVIDDAGRGEEQRWRQHAAEHRQPRAQAPVEQDDRQRDHADEIGGAVVVEDDPARPVLPGEHAHHQEDEEQRRAGPGGDEAGEDAEQHQRRAHEDRRVDEIEAVHGGRALLLRGGRIRPLWRRCHSRGKAAPAVAQPAASSAAILPQRLHRRGQAAGSSLRATRLEPNRPPEVKG